MKSFAVVHFKNDNTVEPVPLSWVSEDKTKCYWPKKKPKKLELQNPDSRPETDWNLLEVKFIKSYGTYDKASDKAEKYRYDSDADTSEGEVLRRKINTSSGNTEPPPGPPAGNIHFGINPHHSLQLTDSESVNFRAEQTGLQSQPHLLAANEEIIDENLQGFADENLGTEGYALLNPTYLATQRDINDLRQELRDFQVVTKKKLEDLKQDINGIKELLQAVLSSGAGIERKTPPCVFQDVLAQLENELTNEDAYNDLVAMLSKIGGSTPTQHVYNILKHTFSKEVSTQIRLTATSGKVALKKSIVTKAIRDSVHLGNKFGSSTDDTKLNSDIGRWFRNQGYVNTEKQSTADAKEHQNKANPTSSGRSSDSDSEQDVSSKIAI